MISVQFNIHSKDLTCNFLNRYSVQYLFKSIYVEIAVFQDVMLCSFMETFVCPECENITYLFTKLHCNTFEKTMIFVVITMRTSDQIYVHVFFSFPLARKQEIIKMTEQLIEAINTGDYEAYT